MGFQHGFLLLASRALRHDRKDAVTVDRVLHLRQAFEVCLTQELKRLGEPFVQNQVAGCIFKYIQNHG